MYCDLEPGKHLILDNASVGDTYRLRRVQHQPVLDPAQCVFEVAHAWEGDYVTPLRVVHDPAQGLYRMWYQAHDFALEEERKKLHTSPYGNVGEPQPIYLCYAQSKDGLHWDRPALNIYPHQTGDNSIVFKGFSYCAGNTIQLLPDAPPEKRYALVNCEWFSTQQGGIIFAYSPDGLHWNYPPDHRPMIHGESDCWNSFIYNPQRGVYMLYMRGWHTAAVGWPNGKGNPRRRIAYSQSPNLLAWSEPQTILTPDELDTNDFYGMQVFRYADYYLGQLWIYDDDLYETIHIQLAWSRDGLHWSRLPQRSAFLPTHASDVPGSAGGMMMIPAQEPVVVGSAMYHYWTEHQYPHSHGKNIAKTYRGRLRLDGFISLQAGSAMGNLITRPFTLQDDSIAINARACGGRIVAELVEPYWYDPQGLPIEGFSAKDFDVFEGDSVHHKLSWRGRSDLSALRGRRMLLRLSLEHAEIFSFTL